MSEILPDIGVPHLQIVSETFESWNRGDIAGAVARFSEDVEWYPHLPGLDETVYRGRDAVEGLFMEIAESYGLSLNFTRMEEAGSCVLVQVRAEGTEAGGGAATEGDWFQLYTFRGPEICRIQAFDDREQALAAAESSAG